MIDLLLVHAHWCGHCKSLMPEWKKMKHLLQHNKKVSVHEIESGDSDKEHRLNEFGKKTRNGQKISIRGFPTIVRFENGEMTEFKGQRTADELVKWATKHKLSGGRRKSRRSKRVKRNRTCKKCSILPFW